MKVSDIPRKNFRTTCIQMGTRRLVVQLWLSNDACSIASGTTALRLMSAAFTDISLHTKDRS
jgi:hypothetical protein